MHPLQNTDLVKIIVSFQAGWPQALVGILRHLREVSNTIRIGEVWLGLTAPCLAEAMPVDLHLLQQVHTRLPGAITRDVFDYLAASGQLLAIIFLHTHHYTCSKWALNAAAEAGHLGVVRFLHDHRSEGCSTHAMDYAARNGHLDVVEFLHRHRAEGCSSFALTAACARGHLGVVRFLHRHRHEGCTSHAMDSAAENGHLEIVRLLHFERHEGCSRVALEYAAKYGHLDIVRFLHTHRREGRLADALRNAAAQGHAAVVAYLLPFVPVLAPEAMDYAARNGALDTVQLLHATGRASCSKRALTWAAMAGQADVVCFLLRYRTEGDVEEAHAMAERMQMTSVARLLRPFVTSARNIRIADVDYIGFTMCEKRPQFLVA
ncbi:hypothetical protein ACHHYP_01897 [Achlya hypogyna]|uniref:Uncharacterized protein n=1 Tax=Achlya hypogyna TaxID=1202772 RepID=A0A1V9Z7S1_ACHHY|nr:hypothetical protein ACHHYP_01897 [Achlya hypogyna]